MEEGCVRCRLFCVTQHLYSTFFSEKSAVNCGIIRARTAPYLRGVSLPLPPPSFTCHLYVMLDFKGIKRHLLDIGSDFKLTGCLAVSHQPSLPRALSCLMWVELESRMKNHITQCEVA